MVGAEDDALPIRMKERGKACAPQVCDLLLIRSVAVHHPYFKSRRFNQAFCKTLLVAINFLCRLGMMGPVNDLASIEREECTAVISQFVRQPLHVPTVSIHRVDVQ